LRPQSVHQDVQKHDSIVPKTAAARDRIDAIRQRLELITEPGENCTKGSMIRNGKGNRRYWKEKILSPEKKGLT